MREWWSCCSRPSRLRSSSLFFVLVIRLYALLLLLLVVAVVGCSARIERLVLLLKAALDARKRLMVTFNVPADKLDAMLAVVPSLKAPTVSALHGGAGFAVQVAVDSSSIPTLIPRIKEEGGSDLVVTSIRMLVA